jgi:membrane protease YdiL (CAAX protease family)
MPVQFPGLNWSAALTGNPLQDILVTPLQYFAPFVTIVYGVTAIFVFGIAYIRTGKLYSAIAYTITLFAAILSFFTQNLYVSLILYTIALFSLAAALYITFGKRDTWG